MQIPDIARTAGRKEYGLERHLATFGIHDVQMTPLIFLTARRVRHWRGLKTALGVGSGDNNDNIYGDISYIC